MSYLENEVAAAVSELEKYRAGRSAIVNRGDTAATRQH